MNSIILILTLSLASASAFASGGYRCISTTPRHHLGVAIPLTDSVVAITNEGDHYHYELSPQSAQLNRTQLPIMLESIHGDMIVKIVQSNNQLVGAIKLRILDETVPLACQFYQ